MVGLGVLVEVVNHMEGVGPGPWMASPHGRTVVAIAGMA